MNPLIFGALTTLVELVLIVFLCLLSHQRGKDRGRREGFKDGYHHGFTDARSFAEAWLAVAEKEVKAVREKVRDEERWP